jgi:hypothetical protein
MGFVTSSLISGSLKHYVIVKKQQDIASLGNPPKRIQRIISRPRGTPWPTAYTAGRSSNIRTGSLASSTSNLQALPIDAKVPNLTELRLRQTAQSFTISPVRSTVCRVINDDHFINV